MRYMLDGKARYMGLGPFPDGMSLAEAREAATGARRLLREGADPIEARVQRRQAVRLETYAYPIFGSLPVQSIDAALVLKALNQIWNERPETASRLRQRIEAVLDWATCRINST